MSSHVTSEGRGGGVSTVQKTQQTPQSTKHIPGQVGELLLATTTEPALRSPKTCTSTLVEGGRSLIAGKFVAEHTVILRYCLVGVMNL